MRWVPLTPDFLIATLTVSYVFGYIPSPLFSWYNEITSQWLVSVSNSNLHLPDTKHRVCNQETTGWASWNLGRMQTSLSLLTESPGTYDTRFTTDRWTQAHSPASRTHSETWPNPFPERLLPETELKNPMVAPRSTRVTSVKTHVWQLELSEVRTVLQRLEDERGRAACTCTRTRTSPLVFPKQQLLDN